MGFKKSYNVDDIISQIRSISGTCNNPRNDGYTAWGAKQDLYQVKWFVDKALKSCPTFALEPVWLHEQERFTIMSILKGEEDVK